MVIDRGPDQGPVDWAAVMQDHYRAACKVVNRQMPKHLRSLYDPDDFVVDAIVELLATPEKLEQWGPSLLVLVAKRRMIDAARSPRSRRTHLEDDLVDHQPSALEQNEAVELRDRMLGYARSPREFIIVDLRCLGHTLPEIARVTGMGVRKLQRFWKWFAAAHEPY